MVYSTKNVRLQFLSPQSRLFILNVNLLLLIGGTTELRHGVCCLVNRVVIILVVGVLTELLLVWHVDFISQKFISNRGH